MHYGQDMLDGGRRLSRDRIFERFYRVDSSRRREKGGTGLGLAIVKGIAEDHGGHVELDTEAGRGSTFRIVLPYADEQTQ